MIVKIKNQAKVPAEFCFGSLNGSADFPDLVPACGRDEARPRRPKRYLISALVLVLLCSVASSETTRKKSSAANKAPDFETFIKKVVNEGVDHSFRTGLAKHLDVPDGGPGKQMMVLANESADDQDHTINVVLDASMVEPKTLCLIFHVGVDNIEKRERVTYFFRTTPKGRLENAFIVTGKNDENNKAIPGSGTVDIKDIKSHDIKKLYHYEIEFWLEDKHRKQATEYKGT